MVFEYMETKLAPKKKKKREYREKYCIVICGGEIIKTDSGPVSKLFQ